MVTAALSRMPHLLLPALNLQLPPQCRKCLLPLLRKEWSCIIIKSLLNRVQGPRRTVFNSNNNSSHSSFNNNSSHHTLRSKIIIQRSLLSLRISTKPHLLTLCSLSNTTSMELSCKYHSKHSKIDINNKCNSSSKCNSNNIKIIRYIFSNNNNNSITSNSNNSLCNDENR